LIEKNIYHGSKRKGLDWLKHEKCNLWEVEYLDETEKETGKLTGYLYCEQCDAFFKAIQAGNKIYRSNNIGMHCNSKHHKEFMQKHIEKILFSV